MGYYGDDTSTFTTRLWISGFLFAVFIVTVTTALVLAWNQHGQEMAPCLMGAFLSLLGSIAFAVSGHSNLQMKKE
jgi:hypothetical protein